MPKVHYIQTYQGYLEGGQVDFSQFGEYFTHSSYCKSKNLMIVPHPPPNSIIISEVCVWLMMGLHVCVLFF